MKKKAIKFIAKGGLKHKIAKRNEKKKFNKNKKPAAKVESKATPKAMLEETTDMLDEMDVDDFLNGDFLDNDDEIVGSEDEDQEIDDAEDSSSEEEDESALDPRYLAPSNDADIPDSDDDEEANAASVPNEAPGAESRVELTMEKLRSIETKVESQSSIKALRALLQIFSDACSSPESDKSAPRSTIYDIRNSSVYNQLMVAVFKHTNDVWSDYFGGDAEAQLDTKKWGKISPMVRRFFSCAIYLLQETTNTDIQRFVLRGLNKYMRFVVPCHKTARKLLKCFVQLWGKSLDTQVCMLAFVRVRDLSTLMPFPFLELCLKAIYLSYMRNAKFTNGVNFQHHIVMGNCVVELYGLDLVSSYQHVFIYIRQLAIAIRKAIASPSTETLKGLLTWRFVNCLKVWAAVVSAYPEENQLKALVYPISQLCFALMRLASVVRYIPLRFQCIKILQQLAFATNTFIPTAPVLLDVLNLATKAKTKKQSKDTEIIELDLLVKLSKSATENKRVQDMIVSKVFELLQRECDVYKYSIAFPEFAAPLSLSLSKFSSKTVVTQWKSMARGLIANIDKRSNWIRAKRVVSDIAPKELDKVKSFLATERTAAMAKLFEKDAQALDEKAAQYSQQQPSQDDDDENDDMQDVINGEENNGSDDDDDMEDIEEKKSSKKKKSKKKSNTPKVSLAEFKKAVAVVDEEDHVENMVWSDDE
ncbi:nucleolar complex protein [Thraustotheca clavata]|uniref:Nucleolar complex protein n=1 Tax=Thraustotheca clavata TaxID=74557 RepID=A0A1V9ZBH9_9STRA|nr:nucleolar complex protein [Thraustotheca clavata]